MEEEAPSAVRVDVEQEITEMFGFVPSFYEVVPDAAIRAAWQSHRDFEFADTEIDRVTKELIGLAMAAHIKCRYCIYFHTEAAKLLGASDAQLREAVYMGGLTVAWSNTITGAQVDLDTFERDVDRALDYLRGA
jgi:AhpD family alkylhydroperoxidase